MAIIKIENTFYRIDLGHLIQLLGSTSFYKKLITDLIFIKMPYLICTHYY